jgi:hypothetical protein
MAAAATRPVIGTADSVTHTRSTAGASYVEQTMIEVPVVDRSRGEIVPQTQGDQPGRAPVGDSVTRTATQQPAGRAAQSAAEVPDAGAVRCPALMDAPTQHVGRGARPRIHATPLRRRADSRARMCNWAGSRHRRKWQQRQRTLMTHPDWALMSLNTSRRTRDARWSPRFFYCGSLIRRGRSCDRGKAERIEFRAL